MISTSDSELERVIDWLMRNTGGDAVAFFGGVLRQSFDEVLDGPRTGRWDFAQLEKTEKTYVGTKVEIVARTALGLERGGRLDLDIEGVPVDVKWAMNSAWQIPREAVGELCLCVGGLRSITSYQVGIVRCAATNLNAGENQDGKKTLSAVGRAAMAMLAPPTPIPPNFVTEMDPDVRAKVMAEPTIQTRVTKLFRLMPRTPIPRDAIRTVSRTQGDPIRRTRADASRADPLEGMRVISYTKSWQAEALGYRPLEAEEFMAIPMSEFEKLPRSMRGNRRPD